MHQTFQELLTRRFALRTSMQQMLDRADADKRALTEAETRRWELSLQEVQDLGHQIDSRAAGNTLSVAPISLSMGETPALTPARSVDFPGVAPFIQTRDGAVQAALSEGGDLQYVIPGHQVQQFRTAYPSIDPFRTAGATITDLDMGWVDAKQPIVVAGTEPSTYSEGSGPSADESASVFVASMDDPAKIAFISLPTEEALDDINALSSVITKEGIVRVGNKLTKLITTALLTSLSAASAVVTSEDDNYLDMLNLIAAIPTWAAGPNNCWMGSRRTRALLQNTRAGADNLPVFDPTLSTLLSYRFVLNDYIPAGKLIFGDFSAVYSRRSGLHLQVLDQAYRQNGKVGFRFYQRADHVFFSDAATASQSEQPLVLLTSDLGS